MDKSLVEQIQKTRHELTEAKISLRHAENDLADAETAFKAGVDYAGLGKNNNARDIALDEMVRTNETLKKLRTALTQCQDAAERAEAAYKAATDERRYHENRTWARLADYLIGRVDNVGNAPVQAAQQAVVESAGEVLERQIGEYKDRYGDNSETEDEIPF